MQIEIASKADQDLYRVFRRLVPQLTNNNPPPSLDDLTALVQDPGSTLIVARNDSDEIVGALTLAVYRVPTGIRSVIEDVIVDSSARGQGIGDALMRRAIELAREKGAASISLTSNPKRAAANRLYLRMGFNKRDTNSYQYRF
jgi:ribosomal protein S18 acetylase RimI-like enzyme